MAVVPFTPNPTVAPNAGPMPLQQITPPAGAFAGNVVGQGLQEVGAATKEVSDLLQQRALAVQDLANKAASDQSFTKGVYDMNAVTSEFSKLKGQDAINALPDYQQRMESARAAAGEGLTPIAKSYYDQESRRVFASLTSSMKSDADRKQEQYFIDSSKAKEATSTAAFQANPTAPGAFDQFFHSAVTEESFRIQHEWAGQSVDQGVLQGEIAKGVSSQLRTSLEGIASTNPELARSLAEQYKDHLVGTDAQIIPKIERLYAQTEGTKDGMAAAQGITTAAVTPRAYGAVPPSAPAIVQHFENQGWSHDVAAALTGHAVNESSLNWQQHTGDSGAAAGLMSWHPDRQADYSAWAAQNGRPTIMTKASAADQQDFVNYELTQGKYKSVGDQLRQPGITTEEASAILMHQYLRPADQSSQAVADRAALARQIAGGEAQPLAASSVAIRAQTEGILNNIEAKANQLYPGTDNQSAVYRADYIESAQRTALSQVNHQAQAARDNEQETVGTLINSAIQNKYNGPQDMAPQERAALNNLPHSEQTSVLNLMSSQYKMWTPERQQNTDSAYGMFVGRTKLGANNNFENLPLSSFGEVSQSQAAQIMKWQTQAKTQIGKQTSEDSVLSKIAKTPAFASILSNVAGTDVPTADRFRGALDMEIENFAAQNKRMPNEKEQMQILNGVAARSVTTAPGAFGLGGGTTSEKFAVPPSEIPAIKASLMKAGLPTDDYHIGKAYRAVVLSQQGRLAPGAQVAY